MIEFSGKRETREAPAALLIPTWALVVLNVYFGIDATRTVEVAEKAAEALMGAAP